MACLSLSFWGIAFCVSGRRGWGSHVRKKGMAGFCDPLCLLEHDCLPPAFEASSGSKGKHGLSGLSAPPLTQP